MLVLILNLVGATMAKQVKKQCNKLGCRKDAISPHAKFCTGCFKKNASFASLQRKTFRGGGGVPGNKGNTTTGQKRKATMKAKKDCNTTDCKKNTFLPRVPCNSGNTIKRQDKKSVNRRTNLCRCTKRLLIVKSAQLSLILIITKHWRTYKAQMKKQGKMHLTFSGTDDITLKIIYV